ncbi:autotransporter assembly complex protein TamA [Rhodoferax sp.]|uniref:autotransporter assembly complex protein TamA n=1 Tax=Rhodoferax sp. TaxID=50421 RepID=UPI0027313526|nr:BamA/TamA family outer membrane protein [Rhodoferax sp.]MDP1528805.1 BamA/TamA family outer membrane protein [Rhodoferax sp.]MDP1943710.1 BamA/TamA family outer membrane protein [Rhodoferax sp.]MDP2440853.1 BamA/TamA family outer membrane protein [Rhodoferax sp.]MDZ4208011.1 BamA/TamA family outer membrane protein [Rhodoferax sp.]
MKHFLLAVLLLLALPWATAEEATPHGTGSPLVRAAFELNIQAPDDVKDLLTRHLELQRYRELTDLSDDELERLLRQAGEDARQLVGTLGYFSPVITLAHQPALGGPALVTLTVTPGEATRIQQVTIQFTGAIADDALAAAQRAQIQASWSLPAGNRFTQNAWDGAKQQALRQLTTLRFPTGRISASLADIDPNTAEAHLQLTLDSGSAYRLGELEVDGLQRYDRALVQRLARLNPGSPYSQADLVAAQQRLTDSGYFDSAFITLDTQADPTTATVQLKLREARLQKLVLGVGASTDSGPRLSAEHTHHKVPGIGWRAVSKLLLDRENHAIGSELTSPPDPSNWRWAVSGLLQNQRLGTLDVSSQQLRAGRKQSHERIDRNLYVQYDRAESVDTDTTQPVIAQSISANYAFAVRYYDSLPFPSAGWGWGAELGGGTTLGPERQAYTRLLTRWQGFLGLGQGDGSRAGSSRLAMRASAGAVIAKDSASLPSTQLFLAGGDNSVRGYGLNDIGVTLADGSTTAGRYLSTGSVEWQRPVRINGRPSAWESTVFIDAGAVANKPSELEAKIGVGVGARWNSPVGPLQLDLAYGVGAPRLRLHMNLGFTF